MPYLRNDDFIMRRLAEHMNDALKLYPRDRIVGIFLQGSQNYGLDYEGSDIDSKLIVLPSLDEISSMAQPASTTYIRENDEHIEIKDIRVMFNTFLKQNVNVIEILFTKYRLINPDYEDLLKEVFDAREEIARFDPYRAQKTMIGLAREKYHALEHPYPSKMPLIEEYGYDGKQLHHLVRIRLFLDKYRAGLDYADCMHPEYDEREYLIRLKQTPYKYSLEEARQIAKAELDYIDTISQTLVQGEKNEAIPFLLKSVQREIIKRSIKKELA